MISQWIKVLGGLLLFLIFYHFPVKEISSGGGLRPLYHHDFQINASVISGLAGPVDAVTFHQGHGKLLPDGYYSQYRVYRVKENGVSSTVLDLPRKPEALQGGLTPYLSPRGSGFLTHPQNGKFYIWYPRLGSHVFFFDQNGAFLWAKESSHYLQAAPSGKWILAMAGDQSRAFFFYPDMEPIATIEGTLLVSTSLAERPENPEKGEVVWLAFLDGDIVQFDPALKTPRRFRLAGPVKSIAAQTSGDTFLAQVEKSPDVDTLLAAAVSPESEELAPLFEINLERAWPATLPLALTDRSAFWMVPIEGGYRINLAGYDSVVYEQKEVPSAGEPGLDDWRAVSLKNGVLFYSSHQFLIFSETLLFHHVSPVSSVQTRGNYIYIDTGTGVLSYELYQ